MSNCESGKHRMGAYHTVGTNPDGSYKTNAECQNPGCKFVVTGTKYGKKIDGENKRKS